MNQSTKFDLFLSYSTDPDYELSRKVESFLESFHNLNVDEKHTLKQLEVCRDGSDFELHKVLSDAKDTGADQDEVVNNTLVNYLKQSDNLLILCSRKSAQSTYVDFEIQWFLENKPEGRIFLAVTEGEELNTDTTDVFSPIILHNKLPYKLAFDFREINVESKGWKKVKDFNDEITGLASQLNGYSSGELRPIWRREEEERLKKERRRLIRQRTVLFIIAFVAITAAIVAVNQTYIANDAENEANIQRDSAELSLKAFKIEEFDRLVREGDVYFRAEEYGLAKEVLGKALLTAEDDRYDTVSVIKNQIPSINKKMEQIENTKSEISR